MSLYGPSSWYWLDLSRSKTLSVYVKLLMWYDRLMKVQFRSCVRFDIDSRTSMTKAWRVAWIPIVCTLPSRKCWAIKSWRKICWGVSKKLFWRGGRLCYRVKFSRVKGYVFRRGSENFGGREIWVEITVQKTTTLICFKGVNMH